MIALRRQTEIGIEHEANSPVADGPELMALLGLRSGAAVDDIIKVALLNPVKDVTSNRGKRIRGKLVTNVSTSNRGQYPLVG